jgi:hypothetical protein
VAADIRTTFEEGRLARATVTDHKFSRRADVTYDYVSLRVQMPDGSVLDHDRMSLPHTMAADLQDRKELDVRVLPGARQPVVIDRFGRAHWRLAAINALMSALGAVLLAAALFAWNRSLKYRGDPAYASAQEASTVTPV